MSQDIKTAWNALVAHKKSLESTTMRMLFDADLDRSKRFTLYQSDLMADFSKHRITAQTLDLLLDLARASAVPAKRDAMFAGEVLNPTETRAVLHTALRRSHSDDVRVDGQNIMPDIHDVLSRMRRFADGVRDGSISGTGGSFTDVVNIGIGGSDLGPAMVYRALSPYRDGPRCHFVSNVDGADLADTLAEL